MGNRNTIAFVFAASVILSLKVSSQELYRGPGYSGIMSFNPAWAGASGGAVLELSYTGFYPGRKLGLHNIYAGFDTFSEKLQGGAGIWFSDNYYGGVINETSGGISWSYHMQAGRKIFVNAGLGASFMHRGILRKNIVFPDQIDPLSGVTGTTSETLNFRSSTALDITAGTVVTAGSFTGSLAVNHLTRPVYYRGSTGEYRLPVQLNMKVFYKLKAGKMNKLLLVPVLTVEMEKSNFHTSAGVIADLGLFSAGSMVTGQRNGDISVNGILSFSMSNLIFIYNTSFNILSNNNMLPASVYHQAGMRISLNNVEKRKHINTIYFPKM